jgi:hypothetical protein
LCECAPDFAPPVTANLPNCPVFPSFLSDGSSPTRTAFDAPGDEIDARSRSTPRHAVNWAGSQSATAAIARPAGH